MSDGTAAVNTGTRATLLGPLQSLAGDCGLSPHFSFQSNLSPSVGLPWGVAVASHPDRGHFFPALLAPDPGLGVSLWRLPMEKDIRLVRKEQKLAQTLYEAVARPHGKKAAGQMVLSAGGVQEVFLTGSEAMRNMGLHTVPQHLLPWRGLHPLSDRLDLPEDTLSALGKRLGTLGRGNQWVMLARVIQTQEPETTLVAGDLMLAVQAGSRGVFATTDTVPLPLHSPQAGAALRHAGAACTFALCNRLVLGTQALMAVRAMKGLLPVEPAFWWDSPFLAVQHGRFPWPDEKTGQWTERTLLLHQRGVSLHHALLRGPLEGLSALLEAPPGTPNPYLPADTGFAQARPDKLSALGQEARRPRWILASDEKNTVWDNQGFRHPAPEWDITTPSATTPHLTPRTLLDPVVVIYP